MISAGEVYGITFALDKALLPSVGFASIVRSYWKLHVAEEWYVLLTAGEL